MIVSPPVRRLSAVGEHRLHQVLLALSGEARDLLAPPEIRQVTAPAVRLLGESEPLPGERRVDRPVRDRSRRLRSVVVGEARDLLVGQPVHRRLHLRRDAELLAEQDELRLDEELRLPGDRWRPRGLRDAAGAVARLAEREPILGVRPWTQKGR